jgi:hypothetical protein
VMPLLMYMQTRTPRSGLVAPIGAAVVAIHGVVTDVVLRTTIFTRMPFLVTAAIAGLLGWVVRDAELGTLYFPVLIAVICWAALHPHGGGLSPLGNGCHHLTWGF